MLALVSPEAFWLLRAWQKRMYGDQRQRASALKAARHQLRNGVLSPTLTRQIAFVTVRGKSLWSTFHKAAVRKREVHDVLALRVVVRGDAEDCMKVLSSIREVWPSIDGRFKNYVDTPKRNGYQALHDTVLLPGGQPMEIQIRTDEMHARAEFGTAAHRRYKGALFWMPRTMLAGVIAAPAMASSGPKSSLPRWSL
ncbi:hypothetical protein AB1Y20_000740 [Prymnesium parvum]|uniref:RelA/SpoT domain-containing protein n=1 Tax=Prymnesium parvum TaxID=97485 RepID=A0AB34K977_PRYPA